MRVLAAVSILGLAACQPTPAPVSSPSPVAVQVPVSGGSMMALLNQQRASQGLGPVREDARLSRAARDHAQEMVSNNYFSHTGRNGSSFGQRARAAGYGCPGAENIAFGQESASEVVGEWMNSPGHRRNILMSSASEYGIGRVGNMWVLIMGRGC